MITYVDVNTHSATPQSSFSGKKPSRSKIRKSRKQEKALWAAYDAFLSGLEGDAAEDLKGNGMDEMWGAFRAFFYKIQDDIVAHILFERPDVNADGGYYACLDYSLIYKFGPAPGGANGDGMFSQ